MEDEDEEESFVPEGNPSHSVRSCIRSLSKVSDGVLSSLQSCILKGNACVLKDALRSLSEKNPLHMHIQCLLYLLD